MGRPGSGSRGPTSIPVARGMVLVVRDGHRHAMMRYESAPSISHRAMPMSAYVVVQIEVTDPGTYETYKELAPPSIAQYGGRYIVRGGATETLEGSWRP